jgi:hypothetical protein
MVGAATVLLTGFDDRDVTVAQLGTPKATAFTPSWEEGPLVMLSALVLAAIGLTLAARRVVPSSRTSARALVLLVAAAALVVATFLRWTSFAGHIEVDAWASTRGPTPRSPSWRQPSRLVRPCDRAGRCSRCPPSPSLSRSSTPASARARRAESPIASMLRARRSGRDWCSRSVPS